MTCVNVKHFAASARRAFTLIELIVVIGIMVLLAGLAVPAYNAMLKGNDLSQAETMMAGYIASARFTAMNSGYVTALVFYEDPTVPDRTAVIMLRKSLKQPYIYSQYKDYLFEPRPNQRVDYLPRGIRVAAMTGYSDTNTDAIFGDTSDSTTAPNPFRLRAVVFNPDGSLLMTNGLAYDNSSAEINANPTKKTYATIAPYWNFNTNPKYNDTAAVVNTYCSTSALVVYNGTEFSKQGFSGATADEDRRNWLMKNCSVVVINPANGSLLR